MTEKPNRPLSPHLGIYRWQWTASYSILHRLTGIALCFGTLLIAAWFCTLGFHDQLGFPSHKLFYYLHSFMTSWFGILMLFGFCWALMYHALNGIRHLFWDMGKGLSLEAGQKSGHGVFIASIILSASVMFTALTLSP